MGRTRYVLWNLGAWCVGTFGFWLAFSLQPERFWTGALIASLTAYSQWLMMRAAFRYRQLERLRALYKYRIRSRRQR